MQVDNASENADGQQQQKDVWTNFYDKLKDVKDYHRKFGANNLVPEQRDLGYFVKDVIGHEKTESLFSGEEDMARRVDMHSFYERFINWASYRKHREKEHEKSEIARFMRKKTEAEREGLTIEEESFPRAPFEEVEYITYLKTFDRFLDIPRPLKYNDPEYIKYLEELYNYMRNFFERQNPLANHGQILHQFEHDFENRFNSRLISEWQQYTHEDSLYTLPTNRLFSSQGTYDAHVKTLKYNKAVANLQEKSVAQQKALIESSERHDRRIARLESLIQRYKEVLGETVDRTIEHLQKKQSRSYKELQEELIQSDEELEEPVEDEKDESESEDEKPVYNPLNLPLGWDSKPIPYWLYKLHGLGTEYKCEICGNYSYWGRRAFERHFQEWRHAFGMRCLKIPNTVHFKEVIKIEDAICLYEKLKKEAEVQTFRADQEVECEDSEGNVMSARAYDDLRRQGLL